MKLPLVDFNSAIKTNYCVDESQRDHQMSLSIPRISGRIQEGNHRGDARLALVCLGPSLVTEWEKIRDFDHVMTCSGAHKFLIDRGIVPTYHVEVDPRSHKIDLMGNPHPEVEYLISSCCHPALFDHLEGHDVKLWHVYTGDSMDELPQVYPRGDWVFTGGSNVGLRAMVLARFMGFHKVEIFGMDYSYPPDHLGEHAVPHPVPAEPEDRVVTVYDNAAYHTTPRMMFYAREFFQEMAMLPDVDFVLHGTGLLQHMAHNKYQPEDLGLPPEQSVLAFSAPQVITNQYVELNRQLHEENPHYGMSGSKRVNVVRYLTKELNTQDVLDYGCGKGTLAQCLDFKIQEYDPAIPGKNSEPKPADIVICSDVLEHVEPDLLMNVIGDVARCTRKMAYLVIHTGPAMKTLPDGRNAHLIQENRAWWYKRLSEHFHIEDMEEYGAELQVFVRPKFARKSSTELKTQAANLSPQVASIEGVKYAVVNEITEWRAKTMRTKEPCTIDWIETFRTDDVFLDIGACVGGYSLWAAVKQQAWVYAIEPESQNYAILNQNIRLNSLDQRVRAFCLAVGDHVGVGELNLTDFVAGNSCHQLDRRTDFQNRPANFKFSQGSFVVTIDYLVKHGMIPQPQHIKIDVDGQEPLIIKGARNTLKQAKSLLIEINQNLPEHRRMVKSLENMGFVYDPDQVKKAERKTGAFKGVAEYVFRRQ